MIVEIFFNLRYFIFQKSVGVVNRQAVIEPMLHLIPVQAEPVAAVEETPKPKTPSPPPAAALPSGQTDIHTQPTETSAHTAVTDSPESVELSPDGIGNPNNPDMAAPSHAAVESTDHGATIAPEISAGHDTTSTLGETTEKSAPTDVSTPCDTPTPNESSPSVAPEPHLTDAVSEAIADATSEDPEVDTSTAPITTQGAPTAQGAPTQPQDAPTPQSAPADSAIESFSDDFDDVQIANDEAIVSSSPVEFDDQSANIDIKLDFDELTLDDED